MREQRALREAAEAAAALVRAIQGAPCERAHAYIAWHALNDLMPAMPEGDARANLRLVLFVLSDLAFPEAKAEREARKAAEAADPDMLRRIATEMGEATARRVLALSEMDADTFAPNFTTAYDRLR